MTCGRTSIRFSSFRRIGIRHEFARRLFASALGFRIPAAAAPPVAARPHMARAVRRGAASSARATRDAELRAPQNGVTVLTPHTPLTAPGFHDDQIPLLSKLVASTLARERIDRVRRVALHADGVAAAAEARAALRRLRLHGRARGVQGRAAPARAARERVAARGERRVLRRPEPLRSAPRTPLERPPFSRAASTATTSRRGARCRR